MNSEGAERRLQTYAILGVMAGGLVPRFQRAPGASDLASLVIGREGRCAG